MTAELDIEFERDVIAHALKNTAYLRDASPVLEAKALSTPQLSWLWGVMKDSWSRFAERPTFSTLKKRAERDFPDEKKRIAYLKELASIGKRDIDAPMGSLDELRRLTRFAAMQEGMTAAAKALGTWDVDEADRLLREISRDSMRERRWEIGKFEDWDARQAIRRRRAEDPDESRRCPTGLKRFDRILRGGLKPEQFGSVLATTNRGKSIALVNFGYASMMAGLRVAHFTFEMAKEEVETRYDSRFTRSRYDEIDDFKLDADELRRLANRFEKRAAEAARLRIVAMPMNTATPAMMESALDEAMEELGGVDLIIADSVDHLVPERKNKDLRLDHSEVYWSFKALLQRRKCAGWTSTHAGREYATKIATTEAAAESYDKSRIVDVQLSLNVPDGSKRRTGDDSGGEPDDDDEASPPLVGYVSKHRGGRAHVEFPIDTDLARMIMRDGVDDDGEGGGDDSEA